MFNNTEKTRISNLGLYDQMKEVTKWFHIANASTLKTLFYSTSERKQVNFLEHLTFYKILQGNESGHRYLIFLLKKTFQKLWGISVSTFSYSQLRVPTSNAWFCVTKPSIQEHGKVPVSHDRSQAAPLTLLQSSRWVPHILTPGSLVAPSPPSRTCHMFFPLYSLVLVYDFGFFHLDKMILSTLNCNFNL